MPRRLRVAGGGYAYHVLNQAVGKTRLFAKQCAFEVFEEAIAQAKERVPMQVLARCVMSNHWHFVLWPREDSDLSEFMRWLTVTCLAWCGHEYFAEVCHARFHEHPVEQNKTIA